MGPSPTSLENAEIKGPFSLFSRLTKDKQSSVKSQMFSHKKMNIVLPRVCQNPSRVFQANPSRQKHVDKLIPHLEELTQSEAVSSKCSLSPTGFLPLGWTSVPAKAKTMHTVSTATKKIPVDVFFFLVMTYSSS